MATIDIKTTRRSSNPLTIRIPDGAGNDWTHLEAADVSEITLISGTGEPTSSLRATGVHRLYIDLSDHTVYYNTGSGAWVSIGVADGGDNVKYTAQSLTTDQKAQARANIGAGTSDGSGGGTGRSDDDVKALVRTTTDIPGGNITDATITRNELAQGVRDDLKDDDAVNALIDTRVDDWARTNSPTQIPASHLVNDSIGEAKLATAVTNKLHSSADITTQIRATTEIPGGNLVNDSVTEAKLAPALETKVNRTIPSNTDITNLISNAVDDVARARNTDRWPVDKVPLVTLDRLQTSILKQVVVKASAIVGDVGVGSLVFLKGGESINGTPLVETMTYHPRPGNQAADNGFRVAPADDQIPFGIALGPPTGNRGDAGLVNVLVAGHYTKALLGVPSNAATNVPQPTWTTNDKIYVGLIRSSFSQSNNRTAYFSNARKDANTDHENVLVGIVTGHEVEQGESEERLCYFDFTGIRAAQDVKDQIPDASGEVPDAATAVPLIAGTAAVGDSDKYAREDHVHPAQDVDARIATEARVGNTARWPTSKLSESVLVKEHQTLTDNEKAQVRANIGAGTGGGSNVVLDFVQLHRGNVSLAQPAYKWTEVTLSQDYTDFEFLLIQWGGSHHAGRDQSQSHRWVKVSDIQATTAATAGTEIDFAGATTRADETALLNKYYRILGRYETTPLADTRESREDDTWGSFLTKKFDAQDNLDARKILLASIQVSDPEPLVVLGVGAIGISDDDIPATGASAVKVKSEASIRRAIPDAATIAPLAPAETAAVGDSTKYARENHVHPAQDVPAPATATPLAPGVAAVGTSDKYAREDHKHPQQTIPLAATALPLAPADTAVVGSSAKYATENHVHPKQDVYTDAKAIIAAGDNITLTTNDTAKTITIAGEASGGGGGNDDAVEFVAQTLTDSQKAIARANISATETGPNGEIYGMVHNTETDNIPAGTLCVVGGNLPNEDTTGDGRVDTPTGIIPVVIGDVRSGQNSSAMRRLAPPYGIAVEQINSGANGKVLLKGLYVKALTGSKSNWAKDQNVYVRRANDGRGQALASTHYIYDNVISSECYQVGVVAGPFPQQDVSNPGGGNTAARVVAFDFTGREILTNPQLQVTAASAKSSPVENDTLLLLDSADDSNLKKTTVGNLNTVISSNLDGVVRYDGNQGLTAQEKNAARSNLDAAAVSQVRTDDEIDGRIKTAARHGSTTLWASGDIANNAIEEKHLSPESAKLQFDTFKANEALSENQLVHLVGSDNDNNVCLIEWNQVPANGGPPVGITTASATANAEVKILVAGHRRLALGGGVNDWAKNDNIYAYRHNQTQNYHFTNDDTDAGSNPAWRVGWVTGTQSAEAATVRDVYFDFRGLDVHGAAASDATLNIAGLTSEVPAKTGDTFVFADNTDSDNLKKTNLTQMLAAVTPDQSTAETGTDNAHAMTPLRTKQAIEAAGVGDLDQLRGDILYSIAWDTTNVNTATVTPTPDNLPSNWRGTSGTARTGFTIGSTSASEPIMNLATPGRKTNAQGFVIRSWENKSGTREYDKEIFLAWGNKLTNSERTILFSDYETDEVWHTYNVDVHPHEPRLRIKRSGAVTSGSERGIDIHWWLGGRGPKGNKGDKGLKGDAGGMPAVPANNGLYIAKRENGNQLGWDAIADHPFRISAVGPKIYHGHRASGSANIRWTPQSALPANKGWKDLTGLTTNYFATGDQFGSSRWPSATGPIPDAIAIGERPSGCMGLVIRAWTGPDTEYNYSHASSNIVQTRVVHFPEIFLPWTENQRGTGASPHEYNPFTPFGSSNNGVSWTSFANGRPALRFQTSFPFITAPSGYDVFRIDIHLWQPTITVTT